ncbi:glycosyltransferase, partial [Frankia sp. AiPs1]|uniref:glycosyltransferase n=1 Tax=Frankia sp. AiPs1 TaxID=573493 RepID=UPI0020447DAD
RLGLVGLEAQAWGTGVVAAGVGGVRTAVAEGFSGVLVAGRDPARYADTLDRLLRQPHWRSRLSTGAVGRAAGFGWSATARGVLRSYRHALSPTAVAV